MVFLLLHIFLSTRARLIWSFIVPFLWTAMGIWMILAEYIQERGFANEIFIFFLAGDFILVTATILIRIMKIKRK
jgi:hypothetical protein